MCGIAGFVSPARAGDGEWLRSTISSMNDAISYRGPDHGAIEVDATTGLGLGHRRLAIVDLSPAGEQPMVSADRRFVIVFNGEVFNAEDIREDLPGIAWRGYSDTEVILEGMARWGIRPTVERLIGMFAFAVWDRRDRTLVVVRDRLGIKPLYWTRQGSLFAFASELKALVRHPDCSLSLDRKALAAYLRFGYVPGPLSIYSEAAKLQPGHILTLPWQGELRLECYWDLKEVISGARRDAAAFASDDEAADALESLLRDAVGRRMIADVPLGAFLSGGVDSSLVTALMQAQSSRPIRTFSIGFAESHYDEAPFAREVARHLGTEHTEMTVSEADALAVIPDLPTMYDEPFADSSQIPTHLVSRLARREVTVALSGDGGDELFAGYTRYKLAAQFQRKLEMAPQAVRGMAASLIRAVPPRGYDEMARFLPESVRPTMLGDKAHKLASVVDLPDIAAVYRRLVAQWPDPSLLLPGETGASAVFDGAWARADLAEPIERMQFADALTYLPDDILTKVDRASMAVALEARVPLLDHRVVAFAWGLPMEMKIRQGRAKWLLRKVLHRHVPASLIERPKAGFAVPIADWLRGRLRSWAEDLLDPDRMRQQGIFDPAPVTAAWKSHLEGRRNNQNPLWTILMFQAWARQWTSV